MAFAANRWEAWGCPAWEHRQMTIGIAAVCDNGQTIVLAADREFNLGMTSGESKAGKHNNFGINWYVAYAASSVPYAFEVIMTSRPMVLALQDKVWHDVVAAVEQGYRKVRNAKTEALYLASWGETAAEFHTNGKDRIPAADYTDIRNKMAAFDLGADLLVAGFDDTARIFTVRNPGVRQDHTGLGFGQLGPALPPLLPASSPGDAHSSAAPQRFYILYMRQKSKLRGHQTSGRKPTCLSSVRIARPSE
jgi:hypothetical protein